MYLYLRDASRDMFFIPLIVSRALWMRQCGERKQELESKDGATKATGHAIILGRWRGSHGEKRGLEIWTTAWPCHGCGRECGGGTRMAK